MRKIVAVTIFLLAYSAGARAADWPMWRYDAARSAAAPDEITANPNLLWSRKLPPVRQAWPLEPEQRISFDASYEPVVAGKLMLLASPNDGSITAYDTETGGQIWKFYTEGPVRCAPACWKGKVYAGSDDGYLYCLNAQTGGMLWKFRGAPADRPDRRQIGNSHLISFWPVRGGPVVANDTVCFAAGVWSIMGVFVNAVDAETGKLKWTNGDLHCVFTCIGGYYGESGMSPQGPLAAIRDRLVIPNGRAMPAGLELATGKLIYYLQGDRQGDSRLAAHGEYAFVGRERVVNLYDFREVASKWAYKGNQPPKGYFASPAWQDWMKMGPGVLETCFLPYKSVEGCDASSAFADGVAYGLSKGAFYAYDLGKVRLFETPLASDHGTFPGLKWDPPLLWQFKTPYAPQDGNIVIKAGNRLYGCAGKKLLAVENLKGEPRIAWERDIDGKPSSLVAADNKLFVATTEGSIYCFGQGRTGKTYDGKPVVLGTGSDAWAEKARVIVNTTGAKSGYCLVLGLTEGRLLEELLKQTDLLIVGVDADARKVEALRRRFDAAGFYGSRVELFTAKPFEFLFPPYLASLVLSEDARAAGFPGEANAAKLFEVLHPYGGTLCLELEGDARTQFEEWGKGAQLGHVKLTQKANWSLMTREGPLPGSAPWSHEGADAARTFCSQDDLVKAPLGILWYGDMAGFRIWKAGVRPLVNAGVVYALMPHAQSVELWAYDAYTGRALWHISRNCSVGDHVRLVAMDDGPYMAWDGKCVVFDPQTGKEVRVFTFNATGAIAPKDLRVDNDVILVACDEVTNKNMGEDYWGKGQGQLVPGHGGYESSMLVCLDRKTGAELWRRKAQERFPNSGLILGAGMVFCVDSIAMWQTEKEKRRGEGLKELPSTVLALDSRTGQTVWSKKIMYENRAGADDWLCYSMETGMVLGGRLSLASAWDVRTGKPYWENKKVDNGPMILRGKTFIGYFSQYAGTRWSEVVYDITTGEPIDKPALLEGFGCNSPLGSRHLLTQRVRSASYIDLDGGKLHYLRNIRPGCTNGLIVADGLLNAPSMGQGCTCSYSLLTSFAMIYMPEVAVWSGTTPLKITSPPALAAHDAK